VPESASLYALTAIAFALLKILDRVSGTDIMHLDIPNAVPIIYWFDANMEPTGRCFLELPQETIANIL